MDKIIIFVLYCILLIRLLFPFCLSFKNPFKRK